MKTLEIENKAVIELKKFMKKYELSGLDVALHTMLHTPRLSEIFSGKRRITADTDIRLCTFFKLQPGHFLKLQIEYDVNMAYIKGEDKLSKIKTVDEVIK